MREITTSALKRLLVMTVPTLTLVAVLSISITSESCADSTKVSCINGVREDGVTACEKCGDNCNWEIKNGQLTVSGTGATYDYNYREDNKLMSTAPWSDYSSQIKSIKIEGLTSIGSRAFKGLTSVSDVFIADTVESIGAIAFADNTFSSLTIPSSVNFVGNWAFGNNPNLKELIISDNLTYEQLSTWGDDAFNSSNQWLETIKCFGNLETCQKNLKKYLSKSVGGECLSMCLKDSIKFLSVSKDQCNNAGEYYWDSEDGSCNRMNETQCNGSGKYYYTGSTCDKIPTDLSKMTCNNGYVLDETAHRCDRHGCLSFADGACTCDKYYYKKEGGCVSFEEGCGEGWLEKNRECIEASDGCGENYRDLGGWCNRVIYTPAEAAEVLNDDNTNFVTITFRK